MLEVRKHANEAFQIMGLLKLHYSKASGHVASMHLMAPPAGITRQ